MGNDIETSEPLWFALVLPLFQITLLQKYENNLNVDHILSKLYFYDRF